MNILLIENQPLADTIKSKRTDIEVYGGLDLTAEEIAADIKSRLVEHYDVVVIGVHVQIANSMLSDNAGIKLLKLLRLHHIDKHVVLYSWMSREMLMGNLRNAIVFSKGVTFYRLPNFINEVQGLDFDKLSHETADKNELLSLFRAEYDPNDRHFDSNMFGVWQLMRVQLAYESVTNHDSASIDVFCPKVFDFLKSYNGLLAQFVNDLSDEDIIRDYVKALHDESCAALIEAEEELRSLEEQLDYEQDAGQLVNDLIDDATNNVSISQLSELFNRKREVGLYIQQLQNQKTELERLMNQYARALPLRSVLDPNSESGQAFRKIIRNLGLSVSSGFVARTNLARREPRIIYVDDMADQGWADVIQRIVYGGANDNFVTISVEAKEPDTIAKEVLDKIEKNKSDLLILDLRLKDERGYMDPSCLSGFEVLRLVNAKNPPIPIMVFTASNKVWSLKEAFKNNATAFWTKGGIGQNEEDATCVKSYLELIDHISWLTKFQWFFQLLAKVRNVYHEIDTHRVRRFWWETKCITYNQRYFRQFTTKSSILNILENAVETARGCLCQMSFTDNKHKIEHLVVNSFVMQIADLLEQIHHYKEIDEGFISISQRIQADERIKDLIKNTRNQAAHNGYLKNALDPKAVIDFVDFVMDYILNMPEVFANCLDADVFENEIKGVQLTPINKRWPVIFGQTIVVPVYRIIKDKEGCRYYFRIDKKNFDKSASVITTHEANKNGVCVKEGDVIFVKSGGDPKKPLLIIEDCQIIRS